MSGSDCTRFRNFVIAATPSSIPSSMHTSMIGAPFSTCCFATASASSYCPPRMSCLNFGDPATFVRSPILMNSSVCVNASIPLSRSFRGTAGTLRGGNPRTASAIAWMCSGVVPQHPPTIFSQPCSAHSRTFGVIVSGVSEKPVGSSGAGNPAFGVNAHVRLRQLRDLLHVGAHIVRPQRTVKAHAQRLRMPDRIVKRLHRQPR